MTRDRIDALFDRARDDGPERVDVTHRVMQRLAGDASSSSAPPSLLDARARRAVLVCTGFSLAAAGVAAAVVLPLWLAYEDPLAGLLQAIGVVTP